MMSISALADVRKPLVIALLVLTTLGAAFLLPKPKYVGLNILHDLNIPVEFGDWTSMDVSKKLNLRDDRYNFISDVFARVYRNSAGAELLFLVLDAGNFHNPKVCYTSSGFSPREVEDVTFRAANHNFNVHALHMERPEQHGLLMFYWLCIDKKIVGWAEQKMTELWSSLFNTRKAGLMMRIEIPTAKRMDEQGIALGRAFIEDLGSVFDVPQREYLFGV